MTDAVYKNAAAAAAVEAEYRRVLARWPVPKAETTLPTRQGPTYVVTSGPDDGPPVVLFHGSQANSAAWLPDVALWSQRFRLYAIDMIGEAGLSAPARPPLDSDAYARWLDDVFAGLGLSHAALVGTSLGTSLGGWLALDYASGRPGFADALALIVPAGIGRQKNFLIKVLPLLLLGPWGARKIRSLVFGPPPPVLPPDLQQISGLMDSIGSAVKVRDIAIPPLTDAQLAALTMPILAVVGGRDVLLDSRDTRARLERAAPHAEIAFIEDGYHFLPGQAPRVMEFLERNLTPRSRPGPT
jgi:pimeloyl-ACP methyl ester carboxylesterase